MNVKGPAQSPMPAVSHRPSAAPARPGVAAADSSLQSVLTDEERNFFDQMAALGPLTYGPRRAAHAGAGGPRGARLDVRG